MTIKYVENHAFSGTVIAKCIYSTNTKWEIWQRNSVWIKFSWFLGSYWFTLFFLSCHVTIHWLLNMNNADVMFANSKSLVTQPAVNTAEPIDHMPSLNHSALLLSDVSRGNHSSLGTTAVSTEVLYWLAKDIIQVLLESAGRKLGTRLVVFWKKYRSYTCKQRHYPRPTVAEASPKTGEALKNRTHLYTNRSKYIENTFTRV